MRWIAVLGLAALTVGVTAQDDADARAMREAMTAYENRLIAESDNQFDIGDFPTAASILRLQFESDPQDYETATNLIWMYGNMSDDRMEIAMAIRYRDLNPTDPEALYPEAEYYYKHKLYVKAIPLLEKAIAMPGGKHMNSYKLLAQCWRRIGSLRQALRVWQELDKVMPGDAKTQADIQQAKKQLGIGG